MRDIAAEIEVAASPERVWDVLTDFDAYPEWNPFMTSLDGRPEAGATLRIRMRRPGGRQFRFRARVLAADPPRELRWVGSGLAHWPGLVRGERRITIEPVAGGRSRVRMQTTFTGLLSSGMRWLDAYQTAFEDMERALKRRAETA